MFWRVQARAAGGDAGVSAHASHFCKHQCGAPHGARAQVHQVVVTRHTIHSRILRHGRDHHAVFQGQAAHGVGREHGRRCRLIGPQRHPGALRKPALKVAQPLRVAQAQVLVADALAAREHGIHELRARQLIAVALAADLKPDHGVPGRVLQAQHVHHAQRLVAFQHRRYLGRRVAQGAKLAGELNRVFNRQLGARTDGEMRGVHRVAHQHHMAVAIEVRPLPALDLLKIKPGRTPQMARIRHQRSALQMGGKELFAKGNRLRLVGLVQAVRQPDIFGALHDKSRGLGVKLVDVGLEPAVLGLFKQKGKGVVALVRAQPDVAVGPQHDFGLKDVRIALAHA